MEVIAFVRLLFHVSKLPNQLPQMRASTIRQQTLLHLPTISKQTDAVSGAQRDLGQAQRSVEPGRGRVGHRRPRRSACLWSASAEAFVAVSWKRASAATD